MKKKLITLVFLILSCAAINPILGYLKKCNEANTGVYTANCAVAYSAESRPGISVYKNLKDYYIEFFEKNIIKRPVVTKYSKEELANMAKEYGVDFYKMRVMLIVEAIYDMNGVKKDLKEIKKMSLPELTKIIYEAKSKFFESLTPEEKAKFDEEYKSRKKNAALRYAK
ncbi:MAG: hypothetical protein LBQ27_01315 [Clostridiales bacterium]|jgi:hypothetical protein|nr:hypothetical protein [Clostridiales bacterium]